MIIIHNGSEKTPLTEYQKDTFFMTKSYGGLSSLQFDINPKTPMYRHIAEETRLEYDGRYYNVKTINERSSISTVTAELDIDGFKDRVWTSFKSTTATLTSILEKALEGSGWSVSGADVIPNRRTVELNDVNRWGVLDQLTNSTMFDIAYEIDNINKVLTVIRPLLINEPTGTYFTDELNLKECTHKGSTSELITRLYAYGKDGLSIALYNEGKDYVENHDYSDKIISTIWRDDRYTNAENLRDAAIEKLKTMARPVSSYTCKIMDLAKMKPERYNTLLPYKLYDIVTLINRYKSVATNYRIVETKEYPHKPELNEASLNSVSAKITAKISSALQSINDINLDNIIDREKVNEINRTVEANTAAIKERYTKGETDTAIESKITQTANEIRTEVSNVEKNLSDNLANAQSAINADIAQAKSDLRSEISQTESAIKSTVYNHLTHGATNYIANPKDFKDTTGWTKSYGADWVLNCSDGSVTMTRTASTGTAAYLIAALSESVTLKPAGKNYVTLSIRLVANKDCRVYFSIHRSFGTAGNRLGVVSVNEIAASNIEKNYVNLKAEDETTVYVQIKNVNTEIEKISGIGLYTAVETTASTACPVGTVIEIQYIQLTDTNTTDTRMTSIEQRADSIVSEVSKKVNDSELSTKITQLPSAVQIAWNTISQIIQFANAQLQIYDSDDEYGKKLFTLGINGMYWYNRQGDYIGSIGRRFYSDTDHVAMNLNCGEYGSYLSFTAQEIGGNAIIRLMYSKQSGPKIKGWHFFDNIYMNNLNIYLGENASSLHTCRTDDGAGFVNTSGEYFTIFNTDYTPLFKVSNSRITCYNTLDMNNYSIINQSDARLKTNIKDCSVRALDVINGIELKEFDWINDGKHEAIGVIAQQVEQIAHELVCEDDNGTKSIKVDKFIWYAIKAIQELSEAINGKKKKSRVKWKDEYSAEDKMIFSKKRKIQSARVKTTNPPTAERR